MSNMGGSRCIPRPRSRTRSRVASSTAPLPHGTSAKSSGTGDGPAAAALEPKPRNFRDPAFWRGRSRTSLKMTVEQGRPGTMMSPFKGVLSDAEIDGVVRYVESFRPAP